VYRLDASLKPSSDVPADQIAIALPSASITRHARVAAQHLPQVDRRASRKRIAGIGAEPTAGHVSDAGELARCAVLIADREAGETTNLGIK